MQAETGIEEGRGIPVEFLLYGDKCLGLMLTLQSPETPIAAVNSRFDIDALRPAF